MDASILNEPVVSDSVSEWFDGVVDTIGTTFTITGITVLVIVGILLILYIARALMVGALARSKGYSFFGNFLLGLVFGIFALVFVAGRPVSYERECVMQDRLAMQTAKELYKLQRARERANTGSVSKASLRQKEDDKL